MAIQGLCCANFSIAADVTTDGGMARSIVINPPVIGNWLEQHDGGILVCELDAVAISDADCRHKDLNRSWPVSTVHLADERFGKTTFDFTIFAPIKNDDPLRSSLPAIMVRCVVHNGDENEHDVNIRYDSTILRQIGNTSACVKSGDSAVLRFALVSSFDDRAAYAREFAAPDQIDSYLMSRFADLESWTVEFSGALPDCHDPDVNTYLRFETAAGMILTKLLIDGSVLTMGYKELNQRDSYWTSFLHLAHFPSLEQRMIEESAEAQRDNGKIPTTILPLIDRNDDIDINEYFVLRVLRYFEYWNDSSILQRHWQHICKAIDFLVQRDTDNDGLPEQVSFWGDWKDVPSVTGRLHSPHFCLLWCAVLKKASAAAAILGDAEAQRKWSQLYTKALNQINKPLSEGGLWDGNCYRARWRDNRTDTKVYEDQVVGILFGVADTSRSGRILAALDTNGNSTEWGYRESWPGNGIYHEGGIWVYLNFVHALALYCTGHNDKALELLRKTGYADLVKDSDWLPHEYLNGINGKQAGCSIQGWNAVFYAAGAFGPNNEQLRKRVFC